MSVPKPAVRSSPRYAAIVTFLTRGLAIFLVVVVHAFLLNVPRAPSTALGLAYGASALLLAVAAWSIWWPTFDRGGSHISR